MLNLYLYKDGLVCLVYYYIFDLFYLEDRFIVIGLLSISIILYLFDVLFIKIYY